MRRFGVLGVVVALTALGVASTATAQSSSMRIVSTSGVPHIDVANYRKSPKWKPGMPKGANGAWWRFMRTTVGRITDGADAVLHTGDQVQGRWHSNNTRHRVFGPGGSAENRKRAITRAGDTIYPWLNQFWPDDTIWGQGDHEIGDMTSSGIIRPSNLKYRAHWRFNDVWKRHHGGKTCYQRDLGPVTVITLDPLVKWKRGILPRVAGGHVRRLATWVDRAKAEGDWVIVQSEIPAVGPNEADRTSSLLLENGRQVLDAAAEADLFLAAEFHAPTVIRTEQGPIHIVHGGTYDDLQWLVMDVVGEDLRLTLRSSQTRLQGSGVIWAPTGPRANNRPVAGPVETVGTAWMDGEGWYDGDGELRTGPSYD